MSTKMIIATLVGFVFSFLLGWVVFGMLLDPYYQSQMIDYPGLMRGHEDMRLYGIALAQLSWSFLFAFIFDRWANIRTFGAGLTGGFIIFLFAYGGYDLMMWSSMNIAKWQFYAVDILVNSAFAGLVGGVIAFMLGRGKTTK